MVGERVFRTRSSADLPGLAIVVVWAKAAGFVRVVHGRLVPVKKNQRLLERPTALWSVMFAAFDRLGPVICPSGWWRRPLVPATIRLDRAGPGHPGRDGLDQLAPAHVQPPHRPLRHSPSRPAAARRTWRRLARPGRARGRRLRLHTRLPTGRLWRHPRLRGAHRHARRPEPPRPSRHTAMAGHRDRSRLRPGTTPPTPTGDSIRSYSPRPAPSDGETALTVRLGPRERMRSGGRRESAGSRSSRTRRWWPARRAC